MVAPSKFYSKEQEASQILTRVPLNAPRRFSGSFLSRPGGQLILEAGDSRRCPMRVTPEGFNIYRNYILANYNPWSYRLTEQELKAQGEYVKCQDDICSHIPVLPIECRVCRSGFCLQDQIAPVQGGFQCWICLVDLCNSGGYGCKCVRFFDKRRGAFGIICGKYGCVEMIQRRVEIHLEMLEKFRDDQGQLINICVAASEKSSQQTQCMKCGHALPVDGNYSCTGVYNGPIQQFGAIIQERLWVKVETFENVTYFDEDQYRPRVGTFSSIEISPPQVHVALDLEKSLCCTPLGEARQPHNYAKHFFRLEHVDKEILWRTSTITFDVPRPDEDKARRTPSPIPSSLGPSVDVRGKPPTCTPRSSTPYSPPRVSSSSRPDRECIPCHHAGCEDLICYHPPSSNPTYPPSSPPYISPHNPDYSPASPPNHSPQFNPDDLIQEWMNTKSAANLSFTKSATARPISPYYRPTSGSGIKSDEDSKTFCKKSDRRAYNEYVSYCSDDDKEEVPIKIARRS